jgi:hypothetical protein
VIAALVAAADPAVDAAVAEVTAAGHECRTVTAGQLRAELARQAAAVTSVDRHEPAAQATYLVVFGADAASGLLAASDPVTYRTGHDDLRAVLSGGPPAGVHLLGWWRTARRFGDDLGPTGGGEVACLVALNIPASELGGLTGDYTLDWTPRPNRALLIDRHDDRRTLIVPFVRPGTLDSVEIHR